MWDSGHRLPICYPHTSPVIWEMRTSYRLSFLHFSLLDLSEKFRCQPIYLREKRMAQSFTDGLPSRLGFDQGKKAAGGDYYLEMCLWKHLCVQARSWCRLRFRFSMRVCIHAAVARRGPRGTARTPASPSQPGGRGGPRGAFSPSLPASRVRTLAGPGPGPCRNTDK